ncbi:ArnT family glycosyltransferase [Streptomyces rimosus]|uniref:ArnT family glycosyltransferase n=1 Tax=Streptomyces rimosus TaxID=1927 RepID=UPI000B312AF7|nr:glycosyltransferase family 39 protein [Streptomyces rimosus]
MSASPVPSAPSPPSASATATRASRRAAARQRPRRRWELWRSPDGQPPWARPALLVIAALAGLLYAWNITSSGLAPFYSTAARSMAESWKAFLFTAFDPGATVTLDKIGGFLWPQALSARLFGFHDWALTLPQCVEGVVCVLVMYRVVRRWQGAAAGLLAAGLFTLTPVAASMFGHAIPDASLIMCLVLAVDQYQRAVRGGRLGALVLAGVWVGLGFQAKMMQAWLIVPALAVGYLLAAPVTLRRRLGHLLTAGVVMGAVSLSWVLLMTFTPKDVRPQVGGSSGDSAFSMVFDYNGFGRFGQSGNGATFSTDGTAKSGGGGAAQSAGRGGIVASDPENNPAHKLVGERLVRQIGWLYPPALLGLAFGLFRSRGRPRTDRTRAGYVMWGTWLLTTAAVLCVVPVPHTAYVAGLAPALAALSAAGAVAMWRAHRADRGSRAARLALPVTVAAQAAWAGYLAAGQADFAPWLTPLVAAAGLLGVAALVLRLRAHRRPLGALALAAACLATLAAPATWSLSVLDKRYGGSSFDAHAGPFGSEPRGSFILTVRPKAH